MSERSELEQALVEMIEAGVAVDNIIESAVLRVCPECRTDLEAAKAVWAEKCARAEELQRAMKVTA